LGCFFFEDRAAADSFGVLWFFFRGLLFAGGLTLATIVPNVDPM
jgi:hypothetical protein